MGSHSVVEESDTTMGTDSVDYTKVFNEQFPFYLSIGMTYDQSHSFIEKRMTRNADKKTLLNID